MTAINKTRWLVALIILLQVADVMTTNAALGLQGTWESNPIMAWGQAHLGGLWWSPKIVFITILAVMLLRFARPRPAFIVAAIWMLVIASNLFTIATS